MKYYGICLAYPPGIDLRAQGLGRYAASFLKAALKRDDVRFVLLCPRWTRKTVLDLCEGERLDIDRLQVVTTDRNPVLLRCYEAFVAMRSRTPRYPFNLRFARNVIARLSRLLHRLELTLVGTKSVVVFTSLLLLFLLLAMVAAVPLLGFLFARGTYRLCRRVFLWAGDRPPGRALRHTFASLSPRAGINARLFRLYREMEEREFTELVAMANAMTHVDAWYCPSAYWPEMNAVNKPVLACVPDIVFIDFSVPFVERGGGSTLEIFRDIRDSVDGADRIVTYSEVVKWETLVGRLQVPPQKVSVVRHAPSVLNSWVDVSGFEDNDAVSVAYCRKLLLSALYRSGVPELQGFANGEVRYLFYASQFRPNKNVIGLLKAYEYLLRDRLIQHKLVLTGDAEINSEIGQFIEAHGLMLDVVCASGLTMEELAACYKLADLAVCPTLSEGGCPFTFTEALSVGTPVIMSRIPVALEILEMDSLEHAMFFDPYDWRDMADKIEWALEHREGLLSLQLPVYGELCRRTWSDVVDDHVEILATLGRDRPSVGN